MSTTTILYADTLFAPAYLKLIQEARSSIQIIAFEWKTGYAQRTFPDEVLDAVIAKQAAGVDVWALLNYSRPDQSGSSTSSRT